MPLSKGNPMGLFSRLFGSSEERQAKKTFHEVEARLRPVSQLSEALLRSASGCAAAVRPLVTGVDEKERTVRETEASFEFVYFLLHMVSRTALATIGHAKRETLCSQLCEVIPPACIESRVGHWPTELKARIRAEFYENLNSAEREYGECRTLFVEDDALSEKSLLGKLARNVTGRLGREGDFQTMAQVLKLSTEAYCRLGLEELVRQAGAAL